MSRSQKQAPKGAKETRTPRMILYINGEQKAFDSALTLAELVEHLGMKSDRVAVELNREIAPRAAWAETRLQDGDRLEIVHFVGGGVSHQELS